MQMLYDTALCTVVVRSLQSILVGRPSFGGNDGGGLPADSSLSRIYFFAQDEPGTLHVLRGVMDNNYP